MALTLRQVDAFVGQANRRLQEMHGDPRQA
jgi:hypothetical protein